MKKLRILKICHPKRDFGKSFHMSISTDFSVNFSGNMDFLSNELGLIYWHGFPFKFLSSNFYPEKVVAIDLSFSNIKKFWTTPKCFKRLKVMKLRHCRHLTTTPDFTETVNLEKLILEGCVSLVKLHPSIGMLKKLVKLNLRDCIQIRSFPCKVEMDSLEVLILSGCLKLDNVTQVSGTFKSLVKLYVDGTAISGFPSFISSITNLQVLAIGRYQQTESPTWWRSIFQNTWWRSIFQKQPHSLVLLSLASLRFLKELIVRNCNISEMCDDIGALTCLERLDFSGNNFTKLPGSLNQLSCLDTLLVNGCKKLESLSELPPNVHFPQACDCTSLQEPPRVIKRGFMAEWRVTNCQKMFRNMSQTRLIDASTTSHASTNQLSFLFECWGIKSWITEFKESGGCLEILSYGNRVPMWFTNKSKGSHVKVELPPYWCYYKFNSYAFCVVCTQKNYWGTPTGYYVNNFDGALIGRFTPGGFYPSRTDDTHMMLCYDTHMLCYAMEGSKEFRHIYIRR